MSAAVALLAGLAAYLGVLGIDWSDTDPTLMRGIAAAAVVNLTVISIAAAIWTVVT